jgi:hypothetical protein
VRADDITRWSTFRAISSTAFAAPMAVLGECSGLIIEPSGAEVVEISPPCQSALAELVTERSAGLLSPSARNTTRGGRGRGSAPCRDTRAAAPLASSRTLRNFMGAIRPAGCVTARAGHEAAPPPGRCTRSSTRAAGGGCCEGRPRHQVARRARGCACAWRSLRRGESPLARRTARGSLLNGAS